MTREELIEKLRALRGIGDPEDNHGEADDLLPEFINDEEVTKAFNEIEKWYA